MRDQRCVSMKSCTCVMLLLLLSCNTSFSIFSFQGSSGRAVRQYNDMDDDSFIGLMGKRSSGLSAEPSLNRDMGDMGDVFVSLFGRRSTDSGSAAWRRERQGGVFRKNPRLWPGFRP
ncbi:tachykinin-3b isoform 2-T2 [Clarias gariepinus]